MPANLIVDAHLDLSMNALEWNRDLTKSVFDIRAREAGRTDKPDRARGTVAFPEMRRGKVALCRRHADRALRRARESTSGLALAGAGLGADAGTARVVSRDGSARRDAPDHRPAVAQSASRRMDARPRGASSDRLHPEPRRRRLDRQPSASGARLRLRPARGRPRALRTGRARVRHRFGRRPQRERARAREEDGGAGHHPGCHASVRHELLGGDGSLSRAGLGEPQQRARARARTTVSSTTISCGC